MTAQVPGIALIGPMGSGKTTIAGLLAERGYNPFSWAGPVRQMASWAYGPINKSRFYEITQWDGRPASIMGRDLLQKLATDSIRAHLDQDFWVRVGVNNLDAYPEHAPWVNDDTRFKNELDALARRGFVIVRLALPQELREQRLVARDGRYDPSYEEHPSEGILDGEPVHMTLWNTADPAKVVDTLVQTIFKTTSSGGRFTNHPPEEQAA